MSLGNWCVTCDTLENNFHWDNHPECWWFGLFLGRWFPLHHLSKLLQLPEYQHSIQAAVTSSGFYGDTTYTASSGGNTNVFMMPIFPHPPSPSSVLNAAVSYSPHGVCQQALWAPQRLCCTVFPVWSHRSEPHHQLSRLVSCCSRYITLLFSSLRSNAYLLLELKPSGVQSFCFVMCLFTGQTAQRCFY